LLPVVYNRNTKSWDIPFNRFIRGKKAVRGRRVVGSKMGAAGSGSRHHQD